MSMSDWVTVCCYCNKYRCNGSSWLGPVLAQSELKGTLSHGACPSCYQRVIGELMREVHQELCFSQGA